MIAPVDGGGGIFFAAFIRNLNLADKGPIVTIFL